jgi:hypothetical protein
VICSAGEGRINIWFSCRFPALVMRAVRCVIVVVSLASVELLGDKLDFSDDERRRWDGVA